MPIYATIEAKSFWKQGHARTLAATHFAYLKTNPDGSVDNEYRTKTCNNIVKGACLTSKIASYQEFLSGLSEQNTISLFAKLEARLILNAGGGIIENGGISLDRNTGLPYIPGSAIKAAARRYAIHQLGATEDPNEKIPLLADICRVFGYGDNEWKEGRKASDNHPHGGSSHSDFWLAMVPLENAGKQYDEERQKKWEIVIGKTAELIFSNLNRTPPFPAEPISPQLPNLAGAIIFLPAYPVSPAKIATDVLTPHHTEYSSDEKPNASDDEDPKPIVFPAVEKGTTYQFTLTANLSQADNHLLKLAVLWFESALLTFGLGAKTNAGYGWFTLDETASKNAEDHTKVSLLVKQYSEFECWDHDAKEEAILILAEKPHDCALWHRLAPDTFRAIQSFAKSQDLDLL